MGTMQMCKPGQVNCDETKHSKKHHFHFWQKQLQGNEQQAIKKQQADIGQPNKQYGTNNEHKNGGNKQHHEAVIIQPRGQKLRQCFGHGGGLAGSDIDEETETIVIERRIKERIVISHAKKTHDHKEGVKHLDV
ncbi:hypothetical protein SOVF_216650 [Spinacia oleracea]|nr:hypothetical protein SOVF_216650 [Spinacia oleracea]